MYLQTALVKYIGAYIVHYVTLSVNIYHTKLQTALNKFQSNEDTLKEGTTVVNYILSSQSIGEDSLYNGVINDINRVSPVDNEICQNS